MERTRSIDVPVRPAATVMLLRDGRAGLEVFMLQRTHSAAFARSQYVFPGGRVDDADHADDFEPVCDVLDDDAASGRLGLAHGGLAWYVAAIRECFEEAGVLLARRHDSEAPVDFADPDVAARFNAARHRVHDGAESLVELCAAEQLLLLPARLAFVAHWLTPVGESRRFDTRFFMAEAPPSQEPLHDDSETIASLWVRPSEALARWEARELQMFPPTVASLRALDAHATVAEAMAEATTIGVPPKLEPRLLLTPEGKFAGVVLPGEDGYETADPPEYVLGGR
jgi:8-oxo-dGTP pyrophosphatase MutT (NUDIX family)